jgi:hypothetical protein
LKTGHHHHAAVRQIGADILFIDGNNPRLGEGAVGQYLDLPTGVAPGFYPQFIECHRQQADGDLFAGGDDHIQLARIGMFLDFTGKADQTVGLAAHCGDHHHDLVPLCLIFRDATRHVLDALRTADRGTAVLLNYQCHDFSMPDVN